MVRLASPSATKAVISCGQLWLGWRPRPFKPRVYTLSFSQPAATCRSCALGTAGEDACLTAAGTAALRSGLQPVDECQVGCRGFVEN